MPDMLFVADLHLHSRYSRATSRTLDLEHLAKWAQIKGVQAVGTADFTHPAWLAECEDKLAPAEAGFFQLKKGLPTLQDEMPASCQGQVRFVLSAEISSIYKKDDKTRKVHNVVFAPSFEAAGRIQKQLGKIGNISSDGRPILKLDCRDLLEITLEAGPGCFLVPAHIWTPHFSVLGAKSGFDSVEACFGDLSKHIFAMETGLSSDPPMNWRLSMLDRFTLISNSDAHSPAKLAREANLLDTEFSYQGIYDAWQTGNPKHCLGTLEFFPEEGKYHVGGCRKCSVRMTPEDFTTHNNRCPDCGRLATMGVLDRVAELADRPEGAKSKHAKPYKRLVPLPEILCQILGIKSPNAKKVQTAYFAILEKLGNELHILLHAPLEDIQNAADARTAEAIKQVRAGDVRIDPGYDGVFGKVHILPDE